MAVKQIVMGEQIFNLPATKATKKDLTVAYDLRDTLLANRAKAAGLAANMIGSSKAVIAFFADGMPIVMINPQIIAAEGQYFAQEGCLSLIGQRGCVRFQQITVKYQTLDFKQRTANFSGWIAEVIQHECDHLQGKVI